MSYFRQSGQWKGYYQQYGQKFPVNFDNFYINPIPQGEVKGSGEDTVGEFSFQGSFNNNATKVRFIKMYPQHNIFYEGDFNGSQIEGHYGFKAGECNQDKFKIWMEGNSF